MLMSKIIPFIKWPGGKRWIIPYLRDLVDFSHVNRYFEPFLGGGSVFFSFSFKDALLSDTNAELINAYQTVRDYHEDVISRIRKIPITKESYYYVRAHVPEDKIDQAARFLFLNRLAFGGMYRVNKLGEFNVPYGGRTPNVLWERGLIENAAKKLLNTRIICQDFEQTVNRAKENDLVYCDPPYTVAHNLNGFQRYNEKIFTWEDQIRLKNVCEGAANKGVKIIISNAANISIRGLYDSAMPIEVFRYSGLSAIPSKRRLVKEYLFLYNIYQ